MQSMLHTLDELHVSHTVWVLECGVIDERRWYSLMITHKKYLLRLPLRALLFLYDEHLSEQNLDIECTV